MRAVIFESIRPVSVRIGTIADRSPSVQETHVEISNFVFASIR